MPRIRQVVSEQAPGVVRLPRNIPVATAQDLGIGAAKGLENFGGTLRDIAQKIQDTDDRLEVTRIRGEYDKGVAEMAEEVKKEADTFEQPALFARNEADLRRNALEQRDRQPVRVALLKYFNIAGPAAHVQAQADALQIANDEQLALLNKIEDDESKKAAEGTPEEGQSAETFYFDLLDGMKRNLQISAVEEGRRQRSFRNKRILKQMDLLSRTGQRKELHRLFREGAFAGASDQIEVLKIMDADRAREEKEQRVRDAAFKDAQEATINMWAALANFGALPDSLAQPALAGLNPYVTPDKARKYFELNLNPSTGEGTLEIRGLVQKYHLGDRTVPRIRQFQKELNELALEVGRPNKLVSAFGDELQVDLNSAQTLITRQMMAGMKRAQDVYKSKAPPIFLKGMAGKLQSSKQIIDMAEMRNRIRDIVQGGGELTDKKVDEIVDELLGRIKQDNENLDEVTNRVRKLVPTR